VCQQFGLHERQTGKEAHRLPVWRGPTLAEGSDMNRRPLLDLALAITLTCCGGTTSGESAVADAGGTVDGSGSGDAGPSSSGQTADGVGTCPSTIDAYCAGGNCPTTTALWCADGGVAGLQPARATGTCNGDSWVSVAAGGDQSKDYYYDATGKLVAIAQWESNPKQPCFGACRYVCVAGAATFDPSRFVTCENGPTWERGADGGGSVPTAFCGH
jgi:hypothetical protein